MKALHSANNLLYMRVSKFHELQVIRFLLRKGVEKRRVKYMDEPYLVQPSTEESSHTMGISLLTGYILMYSILIIKNEWQKAFLFWEFQEW